MLGVQASSYEQNEFSLMLLVHQSSPWRRRSAPQRVKVVVNESVGKAAAPFLLVVVNKPRDHVTPSTASTGNQLMTGLGGGAEDCGSFVAVPGFVWLQSFRESPLRFC